jgi:hypothetical protein
VMGLCRGRDGNRQVPSLPHSFTLTGLKSETN